MNDELKGGVMKVDRVSNYYMTCNFIEIFTTTRMECSCIFYLITKNSSGRNYF